MEYSLHICAAPYAIRAAWRCCARRLLPYWTMTERINAPSPLHPLFWLYRHLLRGPTTCEIERRPMDGIGQGGLPIHGRRQFGQVAGEFSAAGCNQSCDIIPRTSSFPLPFYPCGDPGRRAPHFRDRTLSEALCSLLPQSRSSGVLHCAFLLLSLRVGRGPRTHVGFRVFADPSQCRLCTPSVAPLSLGCPALIRCLAPPGSVIFMGN